MNTFNVSLSPSFCLLYWLYTYIVYFNTNLNLSLNVPLSLLLGNDPDVKIYCNSPL